MMIFYVTKESFSVGLRDILVSFIKREEIEVWSEYTQPGDPFLKSYRAQVSSESDLDKVWDELRKIFQDHQSWTEILRTGVCREMKRAADSGFFDGARIGWNTAIQEVLRLPDKTEENIKRMLCIE